MKHTLRTASVAAFAGTLLLFAGTFLHPTGADPSDTVAAFAEYANDPLWVFSHLLQLLGVALIVCVMISLTRLLANGTASGLAWVGAGGAIVGLGVAAATQAVDGIALKMMVDAWAASSEPDKAAIFHGAYAVRQIEVGLASIMSLLFGLTMCVYGLAVIADQRLPKWLGWLGVTAGIPTAIAGVVFAYTGFSALAMVISMPANLLLLIWIVALGSIFWRHASQQDSTGQS